LHLETQPQLQKPGTHISLILRAPHDAGKVPLMLFSKIDLRHGMSQTSLSYLRFIAPGNVVKVLLACAVSPASMMWMTAQHNKSSRHRQK
jgi:hypothetical protein